MEVTAATEFEEKITMRSEWLGVIGVWTGGGGMWQERPSLGRSRREKRYNEEKGGLESPAEGGGEDVQ